MNYQEPTNVIYPTKVYSMAGSGSDVMASWHNGNAKATFIQNGGSLSRMAPMDWASTSVMRNNGREIRNEWKPGERQVLLFPWTPRDSVAFEFRKCRCAECIRCGTKAEKEKAVDRNITKIAKNQVRSFFPAVEVNRAVSTQMKNVAEFPLRKTNGYASYKPWSVCDLYPRETYASQADRNYGYTACDRELNGRKSRTHLLHPARPIRAEPAAPSRLTSYHIGHTAKEKTMKEYVRCFENSFSCAIGRDESERVIETSRAPTTNEPATLMRSGASKLSLSHRKCTETHSSGVTSNTPVSTHLTRKIVAPCVPASVQNKELSFLYSGLHPDSCRQGWDGPNPLRTRREVERSQKNCVQNAIGKFDCDQLTFPEREALCASSELKYTVNQRSDHRSENRPGIGVKNDVKAKAVVPNTRTFDVFCDKMDGFPGKAQSDSSDAMKETEKPQEDSNVQTTMLQSSKGTKRACPKRQQDEKAKHRRRTTKARGVEKETDQRPGSCPDSAEQMTRLNSGRSNASDEKIDTCPSPDLEKAVGKEVELAREIRESLEDSVNVKPAEESRPHQGEALPLESHIFNESRAREERIRNLKMLQLEQEQALDNLLTKRPICLKLCCDIENDCGVKPPSHQQRTQHPNRSENGGDSRLKKTGNHGLAGHDTESSGMNQMKKGRTAKRKSPKKRWSKIWNRISGMKTKKETRRGIIKKKKESVDENQNLSTDEYTALMGLVNLSKG